MSVGKGERRAKHANSCTRKIGHTSREAALAALWSLARNRGANTSRMRVYKCLACGLFHYGNLPGAGRRR